MKRISRVGLGVCLLLVLQGDIPFLNPYPRLKDSAHGRLLPQTEDIQLQIGIVQRFGENIKDHLIIKSTSKEPITIKIPDQPPLEVSQLEVNIVQKPLKEPILEERLVLSDHSTYETAEDSARSWKAKGIPVEIAQPKHWEVWAKRANYSNPLVLRWLLKNLQVEGYKQPYLDSKLLQTQPVLSFQVGTKNFQSTQLDITSKKSLIQVTEKTQHTTTRVYPGSLHFQPNAYNSYTLVNQVSLESYLRGVVPNEIGPNAPLNALKAQVILARTYVLRNLRRFQVDNYQLCATIHCQVYYGLTETSSEADKAIKETKGLVLTYNDELIDALYSAMTGGVTATFQDIWNGSEKPYLKSLIDSPGPIWNLSQQSLANETSFRKFIALKNGFNESERNLFRWNKLNTLEELSKQLKEYLQQRHLPNDNFQKILDIKITKRSDSGHILNLVIHTDKGEIELQKNEIRGAFDAPFSTLFYLDPIYDTQNKLTGYHFIGGGMGHGVGFSQYGSYNLAKMGWSSEKILNFYYPNTKVMPLSPSITYWKEETNP